MGSTSLPPSGALVVGPDGGGVGLGGDVGPGGCGGPGGDGVVPEIK